MSCAKTFVSCYILTLYSNEESVRKKYIDSLPFYRAMPKTKSYKQSVTYITSSFQVQIKGPEESPEINTWKELEIYLVDKTRAIRYREVTFF